MKISIDELDRGSARQPHNGETTANFLTDEQTLEDGVNYGIADCRRRLRSQRSTHRAQHHPPKDGSNVDVNPAAGRVGSYAEILANVSMNQSSLSRLVECLLEPNTSSREESLEREEAVIT